MGVSVRTRSVGGRFLDTARWVMPLVFALVACGGESSDDDDDGGAGGESAAGTGGASGKGGNGSGGTATAGTGAVGNGGNAGSGTAGKGGTGGTAAGTGGTGTPIQVGDCDEFTPCGGNPEGTWRVTDTCMELTFSALPAGCENMVDDYTVDMVGTYTFAGGTVTSNVAMNTQVTLVIDDVCAQAVGGSPVITAQLICPALEQQASSDPETTMTCDFDGTNCVCLQSQVPAAEQSVDTYQVSGNQLIGPDGQAVDFCTEGNSLLLQTSQTPDDTSVVSELKLVLELTRE